MQEKNATFRAKAPLVVGISNRVLKTSWGGHKNPPKTLKASSGGKQAKINKVSIIFGLIVFGIMGFGLMVFGLMECIQTQLLTPNNAATGEFVSFMLVTAL